jgi:signal transduction histidine kinase
LTFFARNVVGFPVIRGLGSAEGLAKTIQKRGYTNCLLVFDELRTFVDKAKIEGSILLSIVNTLFDETRAENHTKGHDIELENVHLSLLSACTLDTFANLFDANFVAIGFPNRLLLVLDESKASIPVPRDVPPEIEQALAQDLGAILYNLRPYTPANPLIVRLTPEALALWGEFYQTIPRTVTGTRIDAIALRLAMLMAISAHKTEIDADVIRAAIEIAKWQLAVRDEVMPVEASNAIAALEQRICKKLKSHGPLRERDLRRYVHAERVGLWAFSTALSNLQQAGMVRYDPKKRVFVVLD